jgi:hypothetical protein
MLCLFKLLYLFGTQIHVAPLVVPNRYHFLLKFEIGTTIGDVLSLYILVDF